MSEVSQALQRIARETRVVFAGSVISMFFGFLSRTNNSKVLFNWRVWSV
jgi:hypothetical protein